MGSAHDRDGHGLTTLGLIAVSAATLLFVAWALLPIGGARADDGCPHAPQDMPGFTRTDYGPDDLPVTINGVTISFDGTDTITVSGGSLDICAKWGQFVSGLLDDFSGEYVLDPVPPGLSHVSVYLPSVSTTTQTTTSGTTTTGTTTTETTTTTTASDTTTTETTTTTTPSDTTTTGTSTTQTTTTQTTTVPTTTTVTTGTTTTATTTSGTTTTATTTVPTTTATTVSSTTTSGTTTSPTTRSTSTSATVLPTTVEPTDPSVAPTTVAPSVGGTAFTGVENAVPLAAIALALLTAGSGLLWAGSRRRRSPADDLGFGTWSSF